MNNLNELAKEIYQTACDKGWHDTERSFGEYIALMHSELSEALEEYRNGKPNVYCARDCMWGARKENHRDLQCVECFKERPGKKPEGIAIELADTIIRILDYCGHAGIDIDEAIRIKHEFNKGRPFRHGGKVI